jgi:hypothetical protein
MVAAHGEPRREFSQIIEKLPILLEQLKASPLCPWDSLGVLPQRGVYVFYEGKCPVYVGRSDRVRKRVREHGQPSSQHGSATFAFLLAKEKAESQGMFDSSKPRRELQDDPVFKPLYTEAKGRICKMSVRVVEVMDPIEQTVFEVYAAMELKTRYNSFENH